MSALTRFAAISAVVAVAMAFASCGGSGGGTPTAIPPPQPIPTAPSYFDSTIYSTAATASLAQASELTAVTQHQMVVNNAPIAYTATVGHLTANHITTGAPQASFFYVAYTLPNRDPATRPITFFYNGGPGSATVWLHLGSFGPKRLVTGDPSTDAPTPFPLVDNAETLLDVSDLVFVDAVGSGFSEAIAPNTNQSFWSVDADAAVFRDFIARYLAVNHRSGSPLVLFGESYGTTRTGVLALLLELAGVRVSGVVLQSSVLDYNAYCDVDVSCAGFVPSYGAIGAYHNRDNPNPSDAELPAFVAQMRTFTTSAYDPAVAQFLSARTQPATSLLTQLSNATGLSFASWQAQFNMFPDFYQAHLLPGMLIGRYDARVAAPLGSPLAHDGDPSSTFIGASFAIAIGTYLANDLQYTNPSTYITLSNAIATWSFSHDGLALPDVIPDLAAALAQNPQLQVLALNGYHDLATPFFQTERDLARLGNTPNVQSTFYRGGHMTYLDDASRAAEKADLVRFYQRAVASP